MCVPAAWVLDAESTAFEHDDENDDGNLPGEVNRGQSGPLRKQVLRRPKNHHAPSKSLRAHRTQTL